MENVRDLDGDLLLPPEALSASNMPQCCFCFLQTSGECETDPAGERLCGALWSWKIRLVNGKERWAEAGSPAPAKPLPKPRGAEARSPWAACCTYGVTRTPSLQCLLWQGFLTKWKTVGFLIESRLENWVPRLLFAKQTKTHNLYLHAEKPSLRF